jgi:glycosyltransferase involved in cell wall biosynthesis
MRRPADLTIVSAAFNEADVLDDVLVELFGVIDHLPGAEGTRVVVVDDGSSDDTWDVLQRAAASEPRLTVLRHDENRGFGAGIRTALEATRTRYALMIPADGQWDPAELEGFRACIEEDAAIAVGVRDGRAIYGTKRRVLSAVYAFLLRTLFGLRCGDLAWVHLYDLERVDWRSPIATSPFYTVEIVLWNVKRGIVPHSALNQIPSTMRLRRVGRTKIATPRVMVEMLTDLLGCAVRVRRGLTVARPAESLEQG